MHEISHDKKHSCVELRLTVLSRSKLALSCRSFAPSALLCKEERIENTVASGTPREFRYRLLCPPARRHWNCWTKSGLVRAIAVHRYGGSAPAASTGISSWRAQ